MNLEINHIVKDDKIFLMVNDEDINKVDITQDILEVVGVLLENKANMLDVIEYNIKIGDYVITYKKKKDDKNHVDIKYAIVTREENDDYDEDFYISNKEDCIKLAEKLLEDVDHYRIEFNYFGIAELIEDEEADFNDDTNKHCTYLILMQEKGYYDKKFWISSKKECHEYIKCLRNKETYFCGYPEKKEYSYLKLAKVIKEAKLKSCLIDV